MARHGAGGRHRPELPEQAAGKAKAAVAKTRSAGPTPRGDSASATGKAKRSMRRKSGDNPFKGIR